MYLSKHDQQQLQTEIMKILSLPTKTRFLLVPMFILFPAKKKNFSLRPDVRSRQAINIRKNCLLMFTISLENVESLSISAIKSKDLRSCQMLHLVGVLSFY